MDTKKILGLVIIVLLLVAVYVAFSKPDNGDITEKVSAVANDNATDVTEKN